MKYKVYIATHFPNRLMIRLLWPALSHKYNMRTTSMWLTKEDSGTFIESTKKDFKAILESDFVIAFHPWYKGSLCEISYALGLNKPIVVLIDKQMFPDLSPSFEQYSDFFPLGVFTKINDLVGGKKDNSQNLIHLIANDISEFYCAIDHIINYVNSGCNNEK